MKNNIKARLVIFQVNVKTMLVLLLRRGYGKTSRPGYTSFKARQVIFQVNIKARMIIFQV